MYQTKKCFKSLAWSRPQRYGKFVEKLNAEVKRDESRKNLINVLNQIRQKKSDEYWYNTLPILKAFQKELTELGKVPHYKQPTEVIKFCVKLFEITSRYQDQIGLLLCAPDEKIEAFNSFNNNMYFCGRHAVDDLRNDSQYGPLPYWNTTKPGEPITMDNICFGPELGFSRRPASYWLKLPKSKKVHITEQTTFQIGTLYKDVIVWGTEGIVKVGVYKFCKTAVNCLTTDLNNLLEGEE